MLSPLRIWTWPLLFALLTASGLATALVSDGWGDIWSWIALGAPVAAIAWFGWCRRPDNNDSPRLPKKP